MAGFFNRINGAIGGFIAAWRGNAITRASSEYSRLSRFALNNAFYDNNIYEPRNFGGCLEDVLEHCFDRHDRKVRIVGHFNPVREIVDSYQNVLAGTWGNELRVDDKYDNKPVNAKLAGPIARIWRDSNLDTTKAELQRYAANLGTTLLKVVKYDGDGPVGIQVIRPEWIFDVERDSRGNVTAVVLKYIMPHNDGTPLQPIYRMVHVVEQINADSFSQTFDGEEQIDDAARKNTFGFCPCVLLQHKNNGTPFGDWAYKGSERAIHAINYRIARQDKSIDRHQFPNWFATAGGPRSADAIDLGEGKMTYVQTQAGTPTPSLTPLVPNINQDASMKFWMECRDMLRGPQPELTINDVKLLSGVSGETLARVLIPAEAAIQGVRPAYEHAVIRALQMAVSMGCDLQMWDVGTGMGEGSGDRAYHTGLMSFQLAKRPALPQTVYELIQWETLERLKAGLAAPDRATLQGNPTATATPTPSPAGDKKIASPRVAALLQQLGA